MKKNIILTLLFCAVLFLNVNSAQAHPNHFDGHKNPPPSGHHDMYRPPISHGHLRHYGGFISPCRCANCYPIGYESRIFYPMHHNHGHFGASIHISI